MVCSAVFITDTKGKPIISRNYRGDIPMSCVERFARYIQEREEMERRPVYTDEATNCTFAYIKVNNVYLMSATRRNSNVVLMLVYL